MLPIEPSAHQYRAGAAALVIVALLTVAMIAFAWVESLDGPLLLPLVVAYFLFNVGFVFAAVKGGLQTKGGRLGAVAISLNFAAMLLSDVTAIWTVLSAGAATAAVVAAYLLINDARSPRPDVRFPPKRDIQISSAADISSASSSSTPR